jgi:hypothetical protein
MKIFMYCMCFIIFHKNKKYFVVAIFVLIDVQFVSASFRLSHLYSYEFLQFTEKHLIKRILFTIFCSIISPWRARLAPVMQFLSPPQFPSNCTAISPITNTRRNFSRIRHFNRNSFVKQQVPGLTPRNDQTVKFGLRTLPSINT